LFSIDTNQFTNGFNKLKSKYPDFSEIYLRNILNIDSLQEISFMRGFITNDMITKLYDTTKLIIPNLDMFTKEMESHNKYLQYHFKGYRNPKVYAFISEYGMQQFLFNDKDKTGIGLGLDMFLGENYPYKNIDPTNPAFSDYLIRAYDQKHMSSKLLNLIIEDQLAASLSTSPKLLDKIINNGKKLYVKKMVAPEMENSVLFELPDDKVIWLEKNELEIWSFLLDNNLLYETLPMKVNRYTNPAPTSPGMPIDSPGGAANYVGYKIVDAACKKMNWQKVMSIKDGQKILELAKYKPKRK
jgi:hypothetical protein